MWQLRHDMYLMSSRMGCLALSFLQRTLVVSGLGSMTGLPAPCVLHPQSLHLDVWGVSAGCAAQVVWQTDTSADAVKARAEEQLTAAMSSMVTVGNVEAEQEEARQREEKRKAKEEAARLVRPSILSAPSHVPRTHCPVLLSYPHAKSLPVNGPLP